MTVQTLDKNKNNEKNSLPEVKKLDKKIAINNLNIESCNESSSSKPTN